MSKKSIREILCENCKMNCKLLANNILVFDCFSNHHTNEGLQKAFESYESQYKAEVEELKKKLDEAIEVIKFYGDPETWISRDKESWKLLFPQRDFELIRDYRHPDTDWIGSVRVYGKVAREFLSYEYGGK